MLLLTKLQYIPTYIGDISRFCLFCLGPLVFLLPKNFKLFGFHLFGFNRHLMNVFLETRRPH